ncbi:MAG: hypothetical protein R3308_07960 [Thiohalobacterales bacterium]|nr:hypothetical protein [Thiohalobacterales bacterium]
MSSLLLISLLLSQWWLLEHQSDFSAHTEDAPCELCLALTAFDPVDTGNFNGIQASDSAAHGVSKAANPPLSCHIGMVRSRGPPALLS